MRIVYCNTANIDGIQRDLAFRHGVEGHFDLIPVSLGAVIVGGKKLQRKLAGKPDQILATGQAIEVAGDEGEDRNHHGNIALAEVALVEEDPRKMRAGMRGIENGSQLLLVVGESLNEVQTVGKHKNGEPCTRRPALYEFQKLLPGVGLVGRLGVNQVE
jgi:hypothetical protein